MTSNYTIIGHRGHMEKGEVVTDEVTIRFVDGDDTIIGKGPTPLEAVTAAKLGLKKFRTEQAIHLHPDVVAAREKLDEAIRKVSGDALG